jgi:DNA-binding CsgD family transcriptional regulator
MAAPGRGALPRRRGERGGQRLPVDAAAGQGPDHPAPTCVTEIPPALRAVGITVREYDVLRLLVDRLGNREIAARLHLSPRTVENHVASLMAKTGHRDRVALGEFAATAIAEVWGAAGAGPVSLP